MEYQYNVHQNEIDYKIIINTNPGETIAEAYSRIRETLSQNDNYCPCKIEHTPDTKCHCREFRESTDEGPCSCGFYSKVLRSDKEKEKYLSEPNFNTQRIGRKSNKEKQEEKEKLEKEKLENHSLEENR